MNILVTGGAGFIASHIAHAYLEDGHTVVVVDNLSTGFRRNVPDGAHFHEMDIRDDRIVELLRDYHIDLINHHAAQIDVRRSVADPKHDCAVNVLGTINLLEAAVAHGLKRFIFASTGGAIYGEQEYFPADEKHPTAPLSPYGITKLCVEKYLNYYHLVHGLDYTIFRYTNVFGPRQSPHGEAGVVAIFCNKLLAGDKPVINGDGLQTRDFVFVHDVVKASRMAVGFSGSDVFNICTGIETNVNRIFHLLNAAYGGKAEELHVPAKQGEQLRSVCTYGKARDTFGWEPEYSIEKGLQLTAEFFR